MIKGYKDLQIYQQSYKLALKIYQISNKLPKQETYEICNQVRRAALSIPLNIAEGYGKKKSVKEFKRFLSIALGSSNEIEVLLDFMKDLGYIQEQTYDELKEKYEILGKRIYVTIERWK